MDKFYTPYPDGYCGDEDNGQTSAWYVFSALGFYPVCPGSGEYALGAPLFRKATISLENGNKVTLSAPDNSRGNRYIRSMSVDGKEYDRNYLTHELLMSGPQITFEMGDTPNTTRGTAPESRPYSFSRK